MGASCVLPSVASLTGRSVCSTPCSRVTFGVLVALPMKFVAKGLRFKVSGTYILTLRPVNDATEGSTQVAPMRAS